MALPIWAEFFKRVKQDPDYDYLYKQPFSEPSDAVLDRLDCQMFKEYKTKFGAFMGKIFGGGASDDKSGKKKKKFRLFKSR